jgi:hypothetical protein
MSASILVLPCQRTQRAPSVQCRIAADGLHAAVDSTHFWRGASGRGYIHTTWQLTECPPVPPAVYTLVRRTSRGIAEPLHFGRVTHTAPTLNLAVIRQRGAQLGADEVHVHLLASCPLQAMAVEIDLRARAQTRSGLDVTVLHQVPIGLAQLA